MPTCCTSIWIAFFASVEIRRRPELADRPVVVGGSTRGVVAAASYVARTYGVRSAMPMGQALRLCPSLVVLPPDRAAYSEASAKVFAIFRDVTPLVEGLSLDEAFLDVTGAVRLLGRPAQIAADIRARVYSELQLTCSVGVAGTKFVAKLASARCKPNGMKVVPVADTLAFLHPLPVKALWGVGERTGQSLRRLGIRTVGELAGTPLDVLRRAVGDAVGTHLYELSWARDHRSVTPDRPDKSISSERTFDKDLTESADMHRSVAELSAEVADRLKAAGVVGRTIAIKVRFADFTTVTRARTLADWTGNAHDIEATARTLLTELDLDRPRIRLLGVRSDNLRAAGTVFEQLTLDAPAPAAVQGSASRSAVDERIDSVLERARLQFGSAAPRVGTLRSEKSGRSETSDRPAGPRGQRAAEPMGEFFVTEP